MVSNTLISLNNNLPEIPEKLLLAHKRGEVIFICGAGISISADLPSFKKLVLHVYKELDEPVYEIIKPENIDIQDKINNSNLTSEQKAEIKQFTQKKYDVVLGMLMRRLDNQQEDNNRVKPKVIECLNVAKKPEKIHSALMRLANRGSAVTIITTNFDLLLEKAGKKIKDEENLSENYNNIETYSLDSIPRPSREKDFSGIFHIHGALEQSSQRISELILSDQDFGEFYLRRQFISNFIYDLSRLFHIVFVGYSVDDPPMRYLLSAIDADSKRFDDLKERFIFYGYESNDTNSRDVQMADWKHRGITPIPYDSKSNHKILTQTFEQWAEISSCNNVDKKNENILAKVKSITSQNSKEVSASNHRLFSYLLRQSSLPECIRISEHISTLKVDLEWFDDFINILIEREYNTEHFPLSINPLVTHIFSNLLKERLEEDETIKWVLEREIQSKELFIRQSIIRSAITQLLEMNHTKIREDYKQAWELIEEYLSQQKTSPPDEFNTYLGENLKRGNQSKRDISKIIDIIKPRLNIKPPVLHNGEPPHNSIYSIISPILTSGKLDDENILNINKINDIPFLLELATELHCNLLTGLNIAHRIGWDGGPFLTDLGGLGRACYTEISEVGSVFKGGGDPDLNNQGIAPVVKLLHMVVNRIGELEPEKALRFVQSWFIWNSPIHVRLCAAMGHTSDIIPIEEIGMRLINMDECRFWSQNFFPEIAILRAKRFKDMNDSTKKKLISRLENGPSDINWCSPIDKQQFKTSCTLLEFQRIKKGGGTLPPEIEKWLNEELKKLPNDYIKFMKIDTSLPTELSYQPVPPSPDNKYDKLHGRGRLNELEKGLGNHSPISGGNSPSEGASDWLKQPGKIKLIIKDLKSINKEEKSTFRLLWKCLLKNTLLPPPAQNIHGLQTQDVEDILDLLKELSDKIIPDIIEQISYFLSIYKKTIKTSRSRLDVWKLIWSHAISIEEDENRPIEILIDIFVAICKLDSECENSNIFSNETHTFQMRKCISKDITSEDNSQIHLIIQSCLIKEIGYLFTIDKDWAEQHLIKPLQDNESSPLLWIDLKLTINNIYNPQLIEKIGTDVIIKKINDPKLGLEISKELAIQVIKISLNSFLNNESQPIFKASDIQQMLRTTTNEVRIYITGHLYKFVEKQTSEQKSREEIFKYALVPFFDKIWPKEPSLSCEKVSESLARLPGVCGEKFADAVEIVKPYLQPFRCWSMLAYSLHYKSYEGVGKISFCQDRSSDFINNEDKAKSLLKLLNLTIGSSENSTKPYHLSEVLEVISCQFPNLNTSQEFQRLLAATHR